MTDPVQPPKNKRELFERLTEIVQHGPYTMPDKRYAGTGAPGIFIEGFWGNTKPGITGVYRHVSPKYLQSYLNEYAFRYNHRNDVKPMFLSMLDRMTQDSPHLV